MKAILEFNLPEDAFDYKCAMEGYPWRSLVRDLNEAIRQKLKHGHSFLTADSALEWVHMEIFKLMGEGGLNLD